MIRQMTGDDIPAAMRLKEAAGWNQTETDWRNLLAIEPEGCWVYEVEDQGLATVAGSTTAICYGDELAWIGMVLVLPAFRGQGIARHLMEHALRFAEERGIARVGLDATDMGRPLYLKLGFVDAMPVERWEAEIPQSKRRKTATPRPALDIDSLIGLDRRAFGADRGKVIESLARSSGATCLLASGAYLLARPGSRAHYLGPCVADDPAKARRLIEELLGGSGATRHFWDLLPDNPRAAGLAQELGFRPSRKLVRMARPSWPSQGSAGQMDWQFAVAGFEYG